VEVAHTKLLDHIYLNRLLLFGAIAIRVVPSRDVFAIASTWSGKIVVISKIMDKVSSYDRLPATLMKLHREAEEDDEDDRRNAQASSTQPKAASPDIDLDTNTTMPRRKKRKQQCDLFTYPPTSVTYPPTQTIGDGNDGRPNLTQPPKQKDGDQDEEKAKDQQEKRQKTDKIEPHNIIHS